MENWKADQLQELMLIKDEQLLYQNALGLIVHLGFDYCSFGIRTQLSMPRPRLIMHSNYPDQWQAEYQAQHYLDIDPSVKRCHCSVLPVLWSDELFADTPEFWEHARSYGLRQGWAQSTHDSRGVESMLTLARSHEVISSVEYFEKAAQILWLCNLLHALMAERLLSEVTPVQRAPLSNRETEVLKWSAEGKTAEDIGTILNLKERTINFHIGNAIRKTGATNKTSAVVQAILSGAL
ncbi:autoinducer binding domain-containing protein [Pseudomonas sp. NA-150]|uniref:autoinducer binding domain-containing protein n=1 Tax=Pseudomonas sp. NA-150 TaxID=3367525 RepID=UPI0037C94C14